MTLHFLQAVFLMLAVLFLASLPRMLVRRIKARRDFDYAMQAVAAEAVGCARKEYKILLDFSPASVQQVENNVLAKLHEIHVNTPMSKSELSRNSTCWGAYIGEVLKRIKGGKWQRDSNASAKEQCLSSLHREMRPSPQPGSTSELPTVRTTMSPSNFRS